MEILSKVVIYDPENKKLALIRSKEKELWSAPYGGWEHSREKIIEETQQKVVEEVGIKIDHFLYVQEFYKSKEALFLEMFWLSLVKSGTELDSKHIDLDLKGMVTEVCWFEQSDLKDTTVDIKIRLNGGDFTMI